MKNTLIVAILLSFISFISMFFYLIATSDIYHDYVGRNVSSDLAGIYLIGQIVEVNGNSYK